MDDPDRTLRLTEGSHPLRPSDRPNVIGPYRLGRLLGEGGFGQVFAADQTDPVERRVAIKILKTGMDTRAVLARFEAERQTLAIMDHPAIARILDAGETDEGRPYFVMDYIDGVPITHYCDRVMMPVPARLDLFRQVCGAVQHAHSKGIIHRDIKPTNILVTEVDGVPAPRVIDFGIAKAMGDAMGEETLLTREGQIIGTPAYMSPEQATGAIEDVDTRTDVYALGALLYELLAGVPPFDPAELRSRGLAEMQRLLVEADPPPPSRGVPMGEVERVAAQRGLAPAALVRAVSGDLDWITLRALEKERDRRYATAAAFADDVSRHVRGEPVVASPASRWYRAGKFVRRNRLAVGLSAAVVLALVAGLIATSVLTVRVLEASKETERARLLAEAEAARASEERDKTEIFAEFMVETLGGVGPAVARGRDTAMLREMMDGAVARIENGELAETPAAEVRLRLAIGGVYLGLGAQEEAEAMAVAAAELAPGLEDGEPFLARALFLRGQVHDNRSDLEGAQEFMERALDIHRRRPEADPSALAENLVFLGRVQMGLGNPDIAIELQREAVDLVTSSPVHPADRVNVHGLFAQSLRAVEEIEVALPHYEEAVAIARAELPVDHPGRGAAVNNLAGARMSLSDAAGALPLFEESLGVARKIYPDDHQAVATALQNTAVCLLILERFEEAYELTDEAVEMSRRLFPGEHNATTALSLFNRAWCHVRLGRPDRGLKDMQEALAIRRAVYGDKHPAAAQVLTGLGEIQLIRGRPERAVALLDESLEIISAMLPPVHPMIVAARVTRGEARLAMGQADEAEAELLEMWELIRDAPGVAERRRRSCLESLVKIYEARGDAGSWDRAREYRGALARLEEGATGTSP